MDNFIIYYRTNKEIWDNCSLAVAECFSKINHNDEQKNLIIQILFEKITEIESGKVVPVIGLQEPMGISERNLYLQVLYEISKHLNFIRHYGLPLKSAIHIAIYTMCDYYYHENHYISCVILDALGVNNELVQNNLSNSTFCL